MDNIDFNANNKYTVYSDFDIKNDNEYIIDDLTQLQFAPFLFLNAHVKEYDKMAKKILSTDNTQVFDKFKELFYSDANIEIIQKQLILSVYNVSKKTFLIEKQSKNHLKIVMDYIYLYYGRNLPYGITEQIRELNKKVVDILTPSLMTHCTQYVNYLKDIETQPYNELPINVSNKGSRTLPSVTTRF
jgi:hypothetical protein